MPQKNSMQNNDRKAGTPSVAVSGGRRVRLRGRRLVIPLIIVIVCAAGLGWWRPWDAQETPPPPVTVCDGVYRTAELDRILGSQIGSYWIAGLWSTHCAVQSGKPVATDADGHELIDTIFFVDIPVFTRTYDAGNGNEWTQETLEASVGQGVEKLDTPLEGNSYAWVQQVGPNNYIHGFWFGDGALVVVKIPDPEGSLDGPDTTQQALDVMPELLTYIVTQSHWHNVLPTPDPSETATSEPTDTSDQAITEPFSSGAVVV